MVLGVNGDFRNVTGGIDPGFDVQFLLAFFGLADQMGVAR